MGCLDGTVALSPPAGGDGGHSDSGDSGAAAFLATAVVSKPEPPGCTEALAIANGVSGLALVVCVGIGPCLRLDELLKIVSGTLTGCAVTVLL